MTISGSTWHAPLVAGHNQSSCSMAELECRGSGFLKEHWPLQQAAQTSGCLE